MVKDDVTGQLPEGNQALMRAIHDSSQVALQGAMTEGQERMLLIDADVRLLGEMVGHMA